MRTVTVQVSVSLNFYALYKAIFRILIVPSTVFINTCSSTRFIYQVSCDAHICKNNLQPFFLKSSPSLELHK